MRFIPSALLAIASLLASAQAPEPYRDASLSAHERAADLLPRLTLDEKISLMMDVSRPLKGWAFPNIIGGTKPCTAWAAPDSPPYFLNP